MNTYLKLDVLQEDIDKGREGSSWHCPIAQALRRIGYDDAQVYAGYSPDEITAYRGGWSFRWTMPKRAQDFAKRFDNRKTVQPCTFRLPLVKQRYDPMPYEPEDLDGMYEEA